MIARKEDPEHQLMDGRISLEQRDVVRRVWLAGLRTGLLLAREHGTCPVMVHELMSQYAMPANRRPSVMYVPLPTAEHGTRA
jgi:hypothetical protein